LLKNRVHKSLNLEAPKCSKTHLRVPLISKKFRGYTPGSPLKGGEEGRGKGGEPPIHIPGYATAADILKFQTLIKDGESVGKGAML